MSNSNSERYTWESKYRDVAYLFNNNKKEQKTENYDLYLGKSTHKILNDWVQRLDLSEKQLEISNRDSNFQNDVPQNTGNYVLRIKKKQDNNSTSRHS